MKTLAPALQDELASGASSLCWCWRITRSDGAHLGFTDHDRTLAFDGLVYEPAGGFEGTEITSSTGLSIDNQDVHGALTSDRLQESDLAKGLYDNAVVEIFRVSWQNPEARVLMRTGNLGEVKREGEAFTAELRSLSHLMDQPRGRIFQYGCDAALGDARCGVALDSAAYRATGTVEVAESDTRFDAAGLAAYDAGWFVFGQLEWLSGAANEGQVHEVKQHLVEGGKVRLSLWQAATQPIEPGDGFRITAGCDRQFATCRSKFANGLNFRGFPHMPGNDFVLSYPTSGDADNDGGRLG